MYSTIATSTIATSFDFLGKRERDLIPINKIADLLLSGSRDHHIKNTVQTTMRKNI